MAIAHFDSCALAKRVPDEAGSDLAAFFDGDVNAALERLTRSLGEMRALRLEGPRIDALRAFCDVAIAAERWELAATAAHEYASVIAETGQVAGLPNGCDTLAFVATASDDTELAVHHLGEGLEVIHRTGTAVALDHALLTAAHVARSRSREGLAAELQHARSERRHARGLVDPVPIARLVDRERALLDTTADLRSAPTRVSHDFSELVELAFEALAA